MQGWYAVFISFRRWDPACAHPRIPHRKAREMTNYKLPPASAYADRTGADRWEDYQRIKEGKPPLLARDITETDSTPEPAPVPELPPLHELRISDPDAYAEIARQFGDYVFRGHDSRAGGGKSPFNRNWD
jgi:hypothetical protein